MSKCRKNTICFILIGFFSLGLANSFAAISAVPAYLDDTVGNNTPLSPSEVAVRNVLDLNIGMFAIYDNAHKVFRKTFLSRHPVILALFSSEGGKLILYRPGKDPLQAPSVPIVYQLLKSVSHSSMALFELSLSHLQTVSDQSWRTTMMAYRVTAQSALDSLDALSLDAETLDNLRVTLKCNIQFMDDCLKKGTFTFTDMQRYTQTVRPYLVKNIWEGAHIQVEHWMNVLNAWKNMLGKDWDETYGVSNALYVTRQNNVLFSVMAQFFGKSKMNTQLFLFETSDFTTTPEQMLDLLVRTVSDRPIGQAFFGNFYLFDYELMGGAARKAIQTEGKKLGIPLYLPPAVPFHSTEWPWKIDPSQGEGPASIDEIKIGS